MSETQLVAIDGTDALATVIVRPGAAEGSVSIEAAARGMSKAEAARVLRHVADMWDPQDTGDRGESTQPAPRERVLTHRWADDQQPHLTIRLTFGPEYTDAGIEEITARVRSASRHGYREADEAVAAPDCFEPGRTYTDPGAQFDWAFRCDTVTTRPDTGERTALGWRRHRGQWEPYSYTTDDWEIHQVAGISDDIDGGGPRG
jgi:hypothetical protein